MSTPDVWKSPPPHNPRLPRSVLLESQIHALMVPRERPHLHLRILSPPCGPRGAKECQTVEGEGWWSGPQRRVTEVSDSVPLRW